MQNRRDFLKTSAKLLGSAGILSSALPHLLFAKNEAVAMPVPSIKLNNGVQMPLLGLGTYSINDVATFIEAIKIGYRLIDSAQMYGNEKVVGESIKEATKTLGINREEFFITTKLSENMDAQATKKSIDSTLKLMGLEYLDLLLIHQPFENAKAMYQAMEQAYKDGKIKAIGVSNFTPDIYKDFITSCEIPPAINQCETHIFYQQQELRKVMQPYGTILESWSPFIKGQSGFFENPTLLKIAKTHNKSIAQIALRFLLQEQIIVIPKASKPQHMQENFNIFDFKLTKADMQAIRKLDKNKGQFPYSR